MILEMQKWSFNDPNEKWKKEVMDKLSNMDYTDKFIDENMKTYLS